MVDGKRRLVLLAIGHAGAGFGFGRVLSGILAHLPDRYIIHQFELSPGAAESRDWVIHPNDIPWDYFGLEGLGKLLPRLNPDIVLIVKDLWYVPDYLAIIRQSCGARIVAYCPIDGALQPHPYLAQLRSLDRLVLYSEFAETAFLQGLETVVGPEAVTQFCPPIGIIPHGLDTGRFFPIEPDLDSAARRREARRQLLPLRPDVAGGFIVLNANRNQRRKAVDLTIAAFGKFAAGKPRDLWLYLHMGVPDEGVNVIALAGKYEVADRLLLTDRGHSHPRRNDSELNLIFNACEVGVNTSEGEGWGLIAFEHGATGAAQIVPDHSACAELWREHGVLAATDFPVYKDVIVGQHVNVDSVADAMERLYSDRNFLEERSQKARENAMRQPSWREVSGLFADLFDELTVWNRRSPIIRSRDSKP